MFNRDYLLSLPFELRLEIYNKIKADLLWPHCWELEPVAHLQEALPELSHELITEFFPKFEKLESITILIRPDKFIVDVCHIDKNAPTGHVRTRWFASDDNNSILNHMFEMPRLPALRIGLTTRSHLGQCKVPQDFTIVSTLWEKMGIVSQLVSRRTNQIIIEFELEDDFYSLRRLDQGLVDFWMQPVLRCEGAMPYSFYALCKLCLLNRIFDEEDPINFQRRICIVPFRLYLEEGFVEVPKVQLIHANKLVSTLNGKEYRQQAGNALGKWIFSEPYTVEQIAKFRDDFRRFDSYVKAGTDILKQFTRENQKEEKVMAFDDSVDIDWETWQFGRRRTARKLAKL